MPTTMDGHGAIASSDVTERRPSRSLAIGLLASGAVAMVLVGLVLALLRPAPPPRLPPGSPLNALQPLAINPAQTTVPLDIISQLTLGSDYVNVMAVGPDAVWLAVQGAIYGDAGTLVRIDPHTARKTASWTIGGDPAAVAAAGDFVWVASGVGDGSQALPEQNTVEQFSATTGALVHVYPVNDPRGLVANIDSALVISATTRQQAAISLLSGGTTQRIASLPGGLESFASSAQSGLALCGPSAYVALSNPMASGSNATIYALAPTGGPVRRIATVAGDFAPAMVCDGTSLYLTAVIGPGESSLIRVKVSDGAVSTLWRGPYPEALAEAAGRLWITYFADLTTGQSVFLSSVDPTTGVESSTRWFLHAPPSRGDSDMLVPDASGLWTVAGGSNLLLHIAVT